MAVSMSPKKSVQVPLFVLKNPTIPANKIIEEMTKNYNPHFP